MFQSLENSCSKSTQKQYRIDVFFLESVMKKRDDLVMYERVLNVEITIPVPIDNFGVTAPLWIFVFTFFTGGQIGL